MDAGSEIFQRVKPKCVALVQITFSDDTFNNTTPIELHNALNDLDKTLIDSVNNANRKYGDDFVMSPALADYIMVPLSKILKKETISNTELEHVLSIIYNLLKYSWCKKGILSKELFIQYITLITFFIGGKPGQFVFTKNSDEKYLNGILCIKELLKGCLNNGPDFFENIIMNTKFIPTLGFLVTILLNIANDSNTSNVKTESLETLNTLFHLINDGEILSMFFPGTVSTIAKIIKSKPHSNVIAMSFTTLSSLTNLTFSDFDLNIEMEDQIDSLNALKANITESYNEEDMHIEIDLEKSVDIRIPENINSKEKRRTTKWLSSTIPQFEKALNIILNIDLVKYEKNAVRESMFQFNVKLIRNCFVSCNSLIPLVLRSLASVCYSDSTYATLTVDSLCYISEIDFLKKIIIQQLDDEIYRMQHVLLSPDSTKIVKLFQAIILNIEILNGCAGIDKNILDDLLAKIQESISFIIKLKTADNAKRKMPVESSFESHTIQNQIMLVTSHYKLNSFGEVQNEYLFSSVFTKETEHLFQNLFEVISKNCAQMGTMDKSFTTIQNGSNMIVESAVHGWISSNIIKYASKASQNVVDAFMQFDDDDDDTNDTENEESSLVLLNICYSSLEISANTLKQCSYLTPSSYNTKLSTIMSLRAIDNSMSLLKEDFEDELIDVLYPVVECLASSDENIRIEAQKVSLNIAHLLYDGSIQKMISENSDYLVDSLSSKLVAEELTPKVPIILSVIVKLGSMDIVAELDDIIKTIFTLLDMYYGYNSLVEGFFLVFDEVISKVYDDLKDWDFDKYALDSATENVEYFGMWGLKSEEEVEEFINKKAEVIDDIMQDSDDEDDQNEEILRKDKILEIDSDDSDGESDSKSIPSVNHNHEDDDDDDSKWTSPIEYKLYTTISNILSYAERLMQSNSIQLAIILLRIINRVLPLLATQYSKFLPLAAQMWELISHTINHTEDLRVISSCVDIFQTLVKYGNTFFTTRFIDIYKTLTKSKRLRPIIENQLKRVIQSQKNKVESKKVNFTSTSTNWEYELFKKICEFLVFALQKLGRFIANDVAISIISITIWYNPNINDYGYFDELAIFLSSYKNENDVVSKLGLD